MHALPIVEYGENDPRAMLINSTWSAPKFPSDEICKLYFDNSSEIYFLFTFIYVPLGTMSRSLSQFRTDLAFTILEWKEFEGCGGHMVALGFVPKLCLTWGSDKTVFIWDSGNRSKKMHLPSGYS